MSLSASICMLSCACPAAQLFTASPRLRYASTCPQIAGADPDTLEEKKRNIAFRDIECLAFSFKNIAKIDNLKGLEGLTKLQLDNNQLTKIESIGHLVRIKPPPIKHHLTMRMQAGTMPAFHRCRHTQSSQTSTVGPHLSCVGAHCPTLLSFMYVHMHTLYTRYVHMHYPTLRLPADQPHLA